MTDLGFGYQALLKADDSGTVTSVIAYRAPATAPLEAVLWSAPRRERIYGPGVVVRYLYDHKHHDRTRPIDRAEAERLAREVLGTELPTPSRLEDLVKEGQRMGWDFGPPMEWPPLRK